MRALLLLLSAVLLCCCQHEGGNKTDVERTAARWAAAYFACDFEEALRYTTAESGKWLRFAASNMTEADIDLLNRQESSPEVAVSGVYMGSQDTLATAYVNVSHWLSLDSIGGESRLERDGQFQVELVKRKGSWKVRMAGLPQSGRQSRD